jgi:hypothetical protein
MMNFKLKAAVAAIALAASMSANAAMTTAASGDSSLILTVLDNANNISATFDLGYNLSALPAAGATWNLATDANYSAAWNSFLGTANLGASKWALFAGDATGTTAGANQVFTTISSALSTATSLTNTQIGAMNSGMDVYIAANNAIGNHSSVANGASSAISGSAFAELASAYGTTGKVNAQGSMIATYGFGQLANTVFLTRAAGNNIAKVVVTNGIQYSLSSNGTISAVPEADISGMLLAGLGLMGFIARRRTRTDA